MRIEVFSSWLRKPIAAKRWYFRFVSGNGEKVAQSEAYNSKQAAKDGAALVRDNFKDAPIVEV